MPSPAPRRGASLRPLAPSEALYVAFHGPGNPLAIQCLVQGTGTLDRVALDHALQATGAQLPGTRLVLGRAAGQLVWRDSGRPPQARALGPRFREGLAHPLHTPDLQQPWDLWQGPTCEVVVLTAPAEGSLAPCWRLVFRAFHGVMDAGGVLVWARAVFKALRGEWVEAVGVGPRDLEAARELWRARGPQATDGEPWREAPALDWPAWRPEGLPSAPANDQTRGGYHWHRVRVPGHPVAPVAQMAALLRATHVPGHEALRLMVPVDLRPELPAGARGTGNLSHPLWMDLHHPLPWQDVQAQILRGLDQRQHARTGRWDHFGPWIPTALVGAAMRLVAQRQRQGYALSAILSHVGAVRLGEFSAPGLVAQSVHFAPIDAPLSPLTLVACQSEDALELGLSMPEHLARGGALEHLAQTLAQTLAQSLAPPAALAPPQRPAPPAPATTPAQLWEARLAHPAREALREGPLAIGHAALWATAEAWAALLRDRGVGQGDVVALHMGRSWRAVAMMLATWLAGAAWVVVDPGLPRARRRWLLSDSGARLMVGEWGEEGEEGEEGEAFAHGLQASGPGCAVLEARDLHPCPAPPIPGPRPPLPAPENLAYIMYTSGSTGHPKGVEVEHAQLAHYIHWAAQAYLGGEPARMALVTALSFDLTLTTLFASLVAGGAVDVYGEPDGAQALLQALREDRADVLKLTPSHLELALGWGAHPRRLRALVVGGENLAAGLCERIHRAWGEHMAIFNEYGPTEATVGCMWHRYDPRTQPAGERFVPLGEAAPFAEVHVLAEHGQAARVGEVGEVWIGGKGVARGYRRKEEASSAGFCGAPEGLSRAGQGGAGRFYRTGDLARPTPCGQLLFEGRKDGQFKHHGYRIEPGDIEAALAGCAGLSQVAVSLVHDTPEGPAEGAGEGPAEGPAGGPAERAAGERDVLVAGLVLASDGVAVDALRQALEARAREALPPWMRPSRWVVLPCMPLTPHGKLDRVALRVMLGDRPAAGAGATGQALAPPHGAQTAVQEAATDEQRLLRLWARVLGRSVHRDEARQGFLALGGDSLAMVELLRHMRSEFAPQSPAQALWAHVPRILASPTPATMLAVLTDLDALGEPCEDP